MLYDGDENDGYLNGVDEEDDDEGEVEDSENWEDEDESDFSDTEEALIIQDFEPNFFNLVNNKVADTENFFDNEQYVLNYVPTKSESKECTCKQHCSAEILPLVEEDKQFSHAECQTDELLLQENKLPKPRSTSSVENARHEISQLRISRESLVNQRKDLAVLRKQNSGSGSESDSDDERKIYAFEEAIDAIDSVIDYKNEVICGREYTMSNNLAPGKVEANLVSRLSSLSMLDLQRLFCKYFSKVVELRFNTKKLENQIEDLEVQHKQVNRRIRRYQNDIRDIENENANRIKDLITYYSNDPSIELSEYLQNSKAAKAARKKQQDLELSLTELLVRHGYLLDGADYDVKQVVKMLGIDPLQLKLYQMEEDDDEKNSSDPMRKLRDPLMGFGEVNPSQGLSRRMREVFNNRRERPATPAAGGHRGHSSTNSQNHTLHGQNSNNNIGHSSSGYANSTHRRQLPEQFSSSRSTRHSHHHPPSNSSHYATNNNDNYKHGYNNSNNLNGQNQYDQRLGYGCGNNDMIGAAYLPSRRNESQPSSNQMLGAEVRRHDKRITIIPRQKPPHHR